MSSAGSSTLGLELGVVASTAVAWKALGMALNFVYNRNCKFRGEEPDGRWAVYSLSFIHAVLGIIAGAYSMIRTPSKEHMCDADAVWRNLIILSSCGYFAQDLISELSQPRKDWAMIFHHIFVPTFLFLAVNQHFVVHALTALLLNEGSTPFMCIRWNLKRIERTVGWTPDEERWYFWNGITFVGTFFVFRVLLIPAIWIQTYWAGCLSPDSDGDLAHHALVYVANANFPILWAMNLFWFYLIVKGAIKALRAPKEVGSMDSGEEEGAGIAARSQKGGYPFVLLSAEAKAAEAVGSQEAPVQGTSPGGEIGFR